MSSDVNAGRRRLLTGAVTVVGGIGAAVAAVPFVASWQPSERAKAIGAPVEADFSKLEPGQMMRVMWRGKPVWIVRRTPEALASLPELTGRVRDPDSAEQQQPEYARNEHRSRRPEILVLVGICTHLGCSPTYIKASDSHALGDEWKGGFFCPCHGSRFDLAGRVYQGVPAPTNLEVPPYYFPDENTVFIGADDGEAA